MCLFVSGNVGICFEISFELEERKAEFRNVYKNKQVKILSCLVL